MDDDIIQQQQSMLTAISNCNAASIKYQRCRDPTLASRRNQNVGKLDLRQLLRYTVTSRTSIHY